MQKLIIDRFEGNYALCETAEKTIIQIEISKLPKQVIEGDFIIMDELDQITKDQSNTMKEKKKRVKKLMEELFE